MLFESEIPFLEIFSKEGDSDQNLQPLAFENSGQDLGVGVGVGEGNECPTTGNGGRTYSIDTQFILCSYYEIFDIMENCSQYTVE